MAFFFWLSVILILYAYAGYPLLLSIYCRVYGKKIAKGPYLPRVDIIIPAFNEEKVIAAKIRNTLLLDYPFDLLKVILISDASTDGTDAIVREFKDKRLTFIRQEKRQGKAAALNRGLSADNGDIIVFSDASILLVPSALKNILMAFKDPEVGCVSGEDHILDGGGEGIYGRYELWIRNLESRCNSIVGASGCFYAQRKDLINPFTYGRAPDFRSVLETIKMNKRAVTESKAIGLMGRLSASSDEFNRKQRTIVRGITTLMDYKELLNPYRYGFVSIELWSHKILRWSVGLLMVIAFVSNMWLIDQSFYLLISMCQLSFYSLAIAGWIKERRGKKNQGSLLSIPLFFCASNFAALVAWLKYLTGIRQEVWESSKR